MPKPPLSPEPPSTQPLDDTLAPLDMSWMERREPQASIPGYEILEELGRGGMGVVYRARHIALNRVVAVKMVLAGAHAGSDTVTRFKAEAEVLARLQHPSIIQVFDVGEYNGQPYFAMEFVEGGSLDRRLNGSPLPPREAAALLEKLARAMHAAHSAGIVHRDLKPANILLQIEDRQTAICNLQSAIPKITDFGLARRLDVEVQTISGALLGTPSYMAPEQAEGRVHSIGPATDVYALGVILFEVLVGRPPFKGATLVDTLEQVRHQEAMPVRQLQPSTPGDLETICLKCLQKEMGNRYASAAALADDLRRFLDDRPIEARPITAAERAWRWCRRNPVVSGLLAAVVVLLLAGVAVAWALAVRAHREADRAIAKAGEAEDERGKAELKRKEADDERGKAEESAKVAKEERGKAEDRRKEADEQRKKADASAKLAAAREREARGLVDQLSVAQGLRLAEAGDLFGALLWFSQGLRGATGDQAEDLSRARIGYYLRYSARPLLVQCILHGQPVSAIRFSPDGERVVCITAGRSGAGGGFRTWDMASAQPVTAMYPLDSFGGRVELSPDGTRVLGVSGNNAQVLDVQSGRRLLTLQHAGSIGNAHYSRDGRRIVTCSEDRTARIWDATTGDPVGSPLTHQSTVNDAVFSLDGLSIATASNDHTARVWDAATTKPLTPPLAHENVVYHVQFRYDGAQLVTAGLESRARLWDLPSGKQAGLALVHGGELHSVCYSPDGTRVLTASQDGSARIWEAKTGRPLSPPLRHLFAVESAMFSPEGRRVLTRGADRMVKLWDGFTGDSLGPPLKDHAGVASAVFSPEGRRVALAGPGGAVWVWDLASAPTQGRQLSFGSHGTHAAYSGDGQRFAVVGGDYQLRIYSADGFPQTAPITMKRDEMPRIDYVVFTDVDLHVVVVGEQKALAWDVHTGRPVPAPTFPLPRADEVNALRDGRLVRAMDGDSHSARIYRAGKPLTPPLSHLARVTGMAFSSDGKRVVTASLDRTARVWDAATGQPLTPPLQHSHFLEGALFSPNGNTLLTFGIMGAYLWDVTPEKRPARDLVRMAELMQTHGLDEQGAPRRLPAAALRDAWNDLRDSYASEFSISPAKAWRWHSDQVTERRNAQDAPAALFHLIHSPGWAQFFGSRRF